MPENEQSYSTGCVPTAPLSVNFSLRPGNTASSNDIESFLESTLENLGATKVGLFRADSGFYDKAIVYKAATREHLVLVGFRNKFRPDHCYIADDLSIEVNDGFEEGTSANWLAAMGLFLSQIVLNSIA